MKENIKSVVVLTAICLVVAVLLAYTNSITAPIIEANNNINLISWSTNMNEADKAIEKIFEYASTAGIQINE